MIKAKQNVAAQTNNEQLLANRNIGRIIVAHEFLSGLPKIPATDWNFGMTHYYELMSISDRDRRIFYEFL